MLASTIPAVAASLPASNIALLLVWAAKGLTDLRQSVAWAVRDPGNRAPENVREGRP
jgi:hypothetical protein